MANKYGLLSVALYYRSLEPKKWFTATDKNYILWLWVIPVHVIFNPLSYCFEGTIGFDVKASFASRPVSRLIRWCNQPGDITKKKKDKKLFSSTRLFVD